MHRSFWLVGILFVLLCGQAAPAAADDRETCSSGSGDAAIAACTRRLKSTDLSTENRAIVLYNRGIEWRRKGDFDRAIADYNESIRLNPKYANAYYNRGIAYREKENFDAALTNFNQYIRMEPTDPDAYHNRGYAKGKKKDYDGAIADYNEAIRLNPNNAKTYFNRADMFDEKGNIDASILDYDRAIRLDGKYANAYFNRSIMKEKKGDLQGAFQDVTEYVALSPEDPDGKRRIERLRKELASRPGQAPATVANLPADPTPKSLPADPGRRVALVIGNSAYTAVANLPNPRRDAETVAAALRRTGFQSVTIATDLSREKLITALLAFAREADKSDWGLVYYAGHGIELGGVNYLIPVDAKLATDRDVELEAVPLNQVLGAVERAGKLRLVMLDACRDNPFASQMRRTLSTRSVGRGLASVEPEAGTLVVYAAKHGETALDGDSSNSPFVTALVKNLAVPGVEIRRLFDLVRDDVLDMTKRRQQPFSYGSLPGRQDFFFVQK